MIAQLYDIHGKSIFKSEEDSLKFNLTKFIQKAKANNVDITKVDIAETVSKLNDVSDPNVKNTIQSVIIVDDDTTLLQLCQEQIARLGHYVESYDSAESAITAIKGDPGKFSWLLTDNNMPGENGSVLAKEVKRRFPHMKVAIITGEVQGVDKDVFDFDVEQIISKPVNRTILSMTLGFNVINKKVQSLDNVIQMNKPVEYANNDKKEVA
jgi:CheY-like chemotaxis protein